MNKYHYLNVFFFIILVMITVSNKIKHEDILLFILVSLLCYHHVDMTNSVFEFSLPTIQADFKTDLPSFENLNRVVQQLYSKDNTLLLQGHKRFGSLECNRLNVKSLGSAFSIPDNTNLKIKAINATLPSLYIQKELQCLNAHIHDIISAFQVKTRNLRGLNNINNKNLSQYILSGSEGLRIHNNVIFNNKTVMSYVENMEDSDNKGGLIKDCNGRFYSDPDQDKFKIKKDSTDECVHGLMV